jgi:Holliday junction resolvasome RuvABC ATP-dependent DNA helicase subunit
LPALQHLLPIQDDEITQHIEPYLLHIGAIHRGPRGRSLTVLGEQLLHRHRAR